MAYVIGEPCVDVLDRACVDECPVDCIYEGGRMLYIHPDECVDCGACEPVCPVEAIYYEDDLPDKWQVYAAENAAFFAGPLPGRDEPLGSPGGAGKLGAVGADTPLVAALPPRASPPGRSRGHPGTAAALPRKCRNRAGAACRHRAGRLIAATHRRSRPALRA